MLLQLLSAAHVCMRCSCPPILHPGEPLDASTSILVAYFEPADPASAAAGLLVTYELFVEARGEGAYKVRWAGGDSPVA
jgi:hypothetical protein